MVKIKILRLIIMDFNFSYDIYPHPTAMFCNLQKTDTFNKRIFDRLQLVPEHSIQLDCRPKLTQCCRYNDKNRDKLPSSCNYVDCNENNVFTPCVGYYKHYISNIDAESELRLGVPCLSSTAKTKSTVRDMKIKYKQ